jgi:hypothetical protein
MPSVGATPPKTPRPRRIHQPPVGSPCTRARDVARSPCLPRPHSVLAPVIPPCVVSCSGYDRRPPNRAHGAGQAGSTNRTPQTSLRVLKSRWSAKTCLSCSSATAAIRPSTIPRLEPGRHPPRGPRTPPPLRNDVRDRAGRSSTWRPGGPISEPLAMGVATEVVDETPPSGVTTDDISVSGP